MINKENKTNLGWYFYKGYYLDIDFSYIEDIITINNLPKNVKNEQETNKKNSLHSKIEKIKEDNSKKFKIYNDQILEYELTNVKNINNVLSNNLFTLECQYPGLLIGSGYNHGTKTEGEFKLGFFFDYTTGLPYIPASSCKGLFRSVFPQYHNKNIKYRKEKVKYLCDLLYKITSIDFFNCNSFNNDLSELTDDKIEFIKSLEKNIFNGLDINDKPFGIYKRDIFYDAIITKQGKTLLADDSITPHGDNPLKNPTPILFVKIAPKNQFSFYASFKDFNYNGITIRDIHKKELFKNILMSNGIGAKTNIGYGQFIEVH